MFNIRTYMWMDIRRCCNLYVPVQHGSNLVFANSNFWREMKLMFLMIFTILCVYNNDPCTSLHTDTLSPTAFAPIKADINGNVVVCTVCIYHIVCVCVCVCLCVYLLLCMFVFVRS